MLILLGRAKATWIPAFAGMTLGIVFFDPDHVFATRGPSDVGDRRLPAQLWGEPEQRALDPNHLTRSCAMTFRPELFSSNALRSLRRSVFCAALMSLSLSASAQIAFTAAPAPQA